MEKTGVAIGPQVQMQQKLENYQEGLFLFSSPTSASLFNAFIFSYCRPASSIWMWIWPQTAPGSPHSLPPEKSSPISVLQTGKLGEKTLCQLASHLPVTVAREWNVTLGSSHWKGTVEWGEDQWDRKVNKQKTTEESSRTQGRGHANQSNHATDQYPRLFTFNQSEHLCFRKCSKQWGHRWRKKRQGP